jgi:hypothetical protein
MLGVVLVVGFLGGAVLAAPAEVDASVTVEIAEIAADLEPDSAVVVVEHTAEVVRDPQECRARSARRSPDAPDIAPAVPPPRA